MAADVAVAALFLLGAQGGPLYGSAPPIVLAQTTSTAEFGASDLQLILRELNGIKQRLDRLEQGQRNGAAAPANPPPRAGVNVPKGLAACSDGSFPEPDIPPGQRAIPGWGLFQFPFDGPTRIGAHQFYKPMTVSEFTYDLHPGGNGRNKPVQYVLVGGFNICEAGRYAFVVTVNAEADDILAQVNISVNGRVVGQMGKNGKGLPIRKGDTAVAVGDVELPVGIANVNIFLRNETWMLGGSLNTAAAFRSDPGLWATRYRIHWREPGAVKEKAILPSNVFHFLK